METTPCPNWRLCGITNSYSGAYCGKCYWMFKKTFEFSQEDTECPICLENTDDNVILPCNHKLCVECFKRSVYGRDDIPQPEFPYSDDEYDPTDEQWRTEPKLIEYNRLYDEWERKTDPHNSSRNCPICRHSINS